MGNPLPGFCSAGVAGLNLQAGWRGGRQRVPKSEAEEAPDPRRHADPFPLPMPDATFVDERPAARYRQQRLRRRTSRSRRVREAVTSLNGLACTRAGAPAPTSSTRTPTASQHAVLESLEQRVRQFPKDVAVRSDREALLALLKSRGFYDLDSHARGDYDPERVKVPQGVVRPRELAERISDGAAHYYGNFITEIERSEEELERMAEEGLITPIEPYWDPVLKDNKEARVNFLRRPHALGLGGFCRRIKGKVGMFFCGKKDGMQRLVVDARSPNQQHRRPPSTRLGTGTALTMLDLSDAAALEAGVNPAETDYYAAAIDLRDARQLLPVLVSAAVIVVCVPVAGARRHLGGQRGVQRGDRRYGARGPRGTPLLRVRGPPHGVVLGPLFCQNAMELAISRAVPVDTRGYGGLSVDRTPVPGLGPGSPVASVYVDNATLIGLSFKDTQGAYARAREELAKVGFIVGDFEEPKKVLSVVGFELDMDRRELRHTAGRAWRLYKSLRALRHLGRASAGMMECINGHLVHFFSLWRCGMSAMVHVYRHAEFTPRNTLYRFDRATTKELEILMGLILITSSMDLSAPTMPFAMCSDASDKGSALAATPTSASEVASATRFRERWRLQEVGPDFEALRPREAVRSWRPTRVAAPAFSEWAAQIEKHEQKRTLRGRLPRWRRPLVEVPVVGAVPMIDAEWCRPERWTCVLRGAWSHPAAIHVKEAHAEALGLRRASRNVANHGHRLLSLGDSLPALMFWPLTRAGLVTALSEHT